MAASKKYDFDFQGKTVLVVEDTIMSYKLMKAVLCQVSAGVLHAKNGLQAVDFCREDPSIDLVIMDLQMPGMNGLDATREIKKMRPGLPVIAATANSFDDEALACREAGCDEFINKPVQFNRLFALMQSLFDRQA